MRSDRVPQPKMRLDLPAKVRSWELTVYQRVEGTRGNSSDLNVEAARTRLVWTRVRSELDGLTSSDQAQVLTV
jgi:hypothetical protein